MAVFSLLWTSMVCPVFGGIGKTLPGHLPKAIAKLSPIGRLPATNELRLAIGLQLRDEAGLDALLNQIYDPASPYFHHYLTPAEFTARFGPTAADYAAVADFALTNGFRIIGTHPGRQVLEVSAPVGKIEQAFHLKLRTYRHPREARDFYAPDAEPTADFPAAVLQIKGLDNFSVPQPKNIFAPASAKVGFKNGSGTGGAYLGRDFRNAYVPGTTLTGAGQSVALLQFDGYAYNDIVAYANVAGQAMVTLTNVPVNGGVSVPGSGNVEVCLDIEMVMSMAPGISRIIVYEGPNGSTAWSTILQQIADDNLARQVSCSWGATSPGSPDLVSEGIFKQMSAQGQSFFNATGDSDAFIGGIPFPSESTNITQVGGTTLTMTTGGGAYTSETVWNWNNSGQPGVGSSGGISANFGIPPWQLGLNMAANQGSTTLRNSPDVALTADNVYVVSGGSGVGSGGHGGTSCAAPLWAGFMALVNQQAAANGQPAMGFVNPALYDLANQSIYNSVFHDITTGNNTWPSSPNAFYAGSGYDLCTGLGTPNGTNLINALVSPDPFLVTANYGFNASGKAGGPFNVSSETFFLTNTGVAPLTWSVINTSLWLNVSSAGGTLAAGGGTTATVSLNTAASNLVAGVYSASLWFSNVTANVGHVRNFSLQGTDPLVLLTTNRFFAYGPVGGPFNPAAQIVTFTNLGPVAVSWSLVNTSAWLDVSATNGTVPGHGAASVTASLDPSAASLAGGTYATSLVVSNPASHATLTVPFQLLPGQSLVQNGGFETGSFSSWTESGNTAYTSVGSGNATYVHSGTFAALLGPSGSLGYLTQNLPTSAGQTYLLSFWLANPVNGTTEQFQANWNGTTVTNLLNPGVLPWNNYTVRVTASSTNTALQFGFRNDPDYFGLDDIAVIPISVPVISVAPTNLTVGAGSPAVFHATVSGSAPLVYQWRKSGTNLANGVGIFGATSNVLTLTSVSVGSAGNYTLLVTNAYGAVTSSIATLTVLLPPAITASTVTNRLAECGNNTNVFSLTATGVAPLGIQWSLDNVPVPGATNASLMLTNLHLPNHAISVIVTNPYGSATNNAVVTVQDTQPPALTLNGGTPIYVELGGAFTDPGATAGDVCAGPVAVVVSGSVNLGAVGTNTLVYRADDGNGNTNFVTRTVIVRDTTPPTISWSFTNLVAAADADCSLPMPDVTGTNFIQATDLSGPLTVSQNPTNNFVLPIGTNVVVVCVVDALGNTAYSTNTVVVQDQTPPLILSQPQSQTNLLGTTANFSVAATACTPLTFQWYSNNAALSAQTKASLTLSGVAPAAGAGNYFVVVTAAGGSSTSAVVTLTVNVPLPVINAAAANPDGSFTLQLAGLPGYPYILEVTTNFFPPGNWLPLATNTLGTNGLWQFTDTSATNYPQQFYRLELSP